MRDELERLPPKMLCLRSGAEATPVELRVEHSKLDSRVGEVVNSIQNATFTGASADPRCERKCGDGRWSEVELYPNRASGTRAGIVRAVRLDSDGRRSAERGVALQQRHCAGAEAHEARLFAAKGLVLTQRAVRARRRSA